MTNPVSMIIYMGIVVVSGFLVCSFGLKNGLERITKFMMLALLAIMVILAVNSIFLKGGSEGLKFYLIPDVNKMMDPTQFAQRLEDVTGLPVKLWDERRTTVEAHQILSDHNYHGKKRKDTVDAVAASLILEGYLAFRKR